MPITTFFPGDGAGAGALDRFAPTFLVGNTAAGDSAVAFSAGGFRYFPDTGNCVQLAAALAAAAAAGGLVRVRRGTYDLAAVGAPASPLAISAAVTVQGEGTATVIRSRDTLNQGIFTMAATSCLRECFLECDASDAGSLGSDALVLCTDNVTIEDVGMDLTTDAGGQLREGIRLTGGAGNAQARLCNVSINCSTTTGVLDPTIGISNATPDLQISNLQVFGGDIAIDHTGSGGCDATNLLLSGWEVSALRTAGGTTKINQAVTSVGAGATVAVGFDFAGGSGHTLSAVTIENGIGQQIAGIRTSPTATVSRLKATECRITGFADGVLLGSTAGGGDVNNCTIHDCQIEAGGHGIRVAENATDCAFSKNRITVVGGGSAAVEAGLRIEGGASARNTVEGNIISVTDALNAAYGVRNVGQQTRIYGNEITVTNGLHGLHSTGERNALSDNTIHTVTSTSCLTVADGALYNTVEGNICFTPDAPYVGPVLVYGGEYGTVNGNVTVVTSAAPAASAGIQLTAASSNSTCTGNTCRGSSVAPIVDDLGAANSVSNNLGAL